MALHPPRHFIPLLAASVVAVVLLGCADDAGDPFAPAPAPQAGVVSGQDLAAALAAKERHTDRLLGMPGVVGTAVGLDDEGHAVVQVYLASPGAAAIPARLDDVPVRTVVSGMIWALADPTTKARPAPMGFSVGHPNITAGTFGAKVSKGSSVYILSNNHVLAASNAASIGDPALQPGPADGGTSADQIGTLAEFVPISFNGSNNLVDAAIAAVADGDVLGSTPTDDAYGAPSSALYNNGSNWPNALINLPVQKYGRTTGLTTGTITGIDATVTVCYAGFAIFCTQSATFVDQLIITPGDFSSGGDSGSLIVTEDANKNPVGLLFAGSSSQTIANRIDHVLNEFGVTVVGEDPPPPESTTDIAIETVSASPSSVTQGESVSIDVTVANVGSEDVSADIHVSVAESPDGTALEPQTVSGLAAGSSVTLNFSWSTSTGTTLGDHTLTASHDFADDDPNNDSGSATVNVDEEGSSGDGALSISLSGNSINNGSTWTGVVTISATSSGEPVGGVTVAGSWSNGATETDGCTTGPAGTCTVEVSAHKRVSSVTFTVDSVDHPDYDGGPDVITVSKP